MYFFPYFNLSLQMLIAICEDVISTTIFRSKWIVTKIKLFLSLWIIFFFPFCNICSDEKIFVAVNVNICRMRCYHINNDHRMNHKVKINIFFNFLRKSLMVFRMMDIENNCVVGFPFRKKTQLCTYFKGLKKSNLKRDFLWENIQNNLSYTQ